MTIWIPCPRCGGDGWMCDEDYQLIRDQYGEKPVRLFGCPKCDGCGEIEDDSDGK